MRKFLTLAVFFFILMTSLEASCSCTTCPEPLSPGIGGGVISQIEISGATNPTIGSNGQGVRSVRLHLIHASLEEIDVILRRPGSPFAFSRLIEQSGNSTSDTVTLEICFINCNEVAEPDPGFPETFDSGAGYGNDSTYTGSYFPSQGANGCFDFKFDGQAVNGIWELAISGSPTFGGTLVDWEIDFYDNDGTTCEPFCIIPLSSCLANGGNIVPSQFTICEGSPSLQLNIPVDFMGNEPDPDFYDYYFVISDEDEVIIEIQEEPDLTAFDPGVYTACGLSVLSSDFALVPVPDGTFSLDDLQNDIDAELYCADLSNGCWTIIIEADDADPQIIGPDTVCLNQLVTYEFVGMDVGAITSVSANGPFLIYDPNLPTIDVAWAPGPPTRTICISYSNVCTTGTVCIEVTIIDGISIEVDGPVEVCEGLIYEYSFSPEAPSGASWDVLVVGGTVISQGGDEVEIEWSENGGLNFLEVTLLDGPCGNSDPVVFPVDLISIDNPFIDAPSGICLNDVGEASVDFDPQVQDYIWSGTGVTILTGQGTNGPITFSADEQGEIELCVELESDCGFSDPVCVIIEVTDPPEPFIEQVDPQCEFEFTLIAEVQPGSTGQWAQTGGPGGVSILFPFETLTEVEVSEPGLYTFEFTEDNGFCEGATEIVVEILSGPEVEEGEVICEGGQYQIEVLISGGTAPYFVDGVEIPGNEFLSPEIPSGESYSFVVSDESGCETIFEGLIECPCVSDAGTMSTDLLEACISTGEVVTGLSDGNTVFDINDIGLFVLHDLPGTNLGNIIATNTDGVFGFEPGMIAGQTYFISFVVGTELNGSFDPNDPCLSVAPGQPIIFYDDPEIDFPPLGPFCETGILEAILSPDVTEVFWSNIGGPGGVSILNPESAITNVVFDSPGFYQFSLQVSNPACTVEDEIEVEVLEPPIPMIEPLDPQCEFVFTLIAELQPGSTGEWTQTGGPGGVTILFPFETITEVEVSEPGLYTFEFTEDNGLCEGTAEVEVEILPPPEVVEGQAFCAGGLYEVELLISGATAPYFVDGVEVPGGVFVSPEIPGGEGYEFLVTDANGCETIVEGLIECPCVSDAGTMSTDLLEACISTGEVVTGLSDGNTVFDINDIGLFVLHDLPGTTLGNIIATNTDGVFGFEPGMIAGQTYYISFVVGTELNGSFDPDDPCLSVAPGQPVIFYDDPEVELLPAGPFCETGILEAEVSPDVTEVFWSNTGGPGAVTILNPTETVTGVVFGPPGLYQFSFFASNPACALEETLEVEFDPIIIEGVNIECIGLDEYIVSFFISGGLSPYTIDIAGSLDGDFFVSEVLDPDQVTFVNIQDDTGCSAEFSFGPVDCLCDNDAGTMSPELLTACAAEGEVVVSDYNGDGILLPGDLSTFVLHDNPGNSLGNIFDQNEDGVFGFVPGMVEGQTYYISHVVAGELNGTFDPDDPCLQVSLGQPVIFYGNPEFEILAQDTICGLASNLEVNLSEPSDILSWSSLSWPGAEPPEITNPLSISTTVLAQQSGIYQFLIQVENPACIVMDTVELEFFDLPTISMPIPECVSSELFEFSFEISGNGSNFEVGLAGILEGNVFTSELLADSILYEFTVVDELGCESVFSVGPIDCSCVSVPGSMGTDTLFFCETGGLVVSDFTDDGFTGLLDTFLWVIHQGSETELINPVFFINQLTFELPDTLMPGQLYYISHIVTALNEDGEPDLESSCLRVSIGQPLFIYELPAFELPDAISTCLGPLEVVINNGNSGTIEVLTNTTGSALEIELQNEVISTIPESAGSVSILYTEVNGLCELTDTLEVSFLPLPEFTNVMVECIGDQFVVSFDFSGGESPYILNGDTLPAASFVSDSFPSETLVEFLLSDANACFSDTLHISENCDCENEAGEIGQTEFELCEGENLELSILNLTGENIPEGFELVYLFLDEPDPTLASILEVIDGNDLVWSDQLETNRPYYIVVAVAPVEDGEIHFSDPCLSISNFAAVIWSALPEVSISGSAEICEGDEVQMLIQVNGTLPIDIVLENNFGDRIEATIESEIQLLNYSPDLAGEQVWGIVEVNSDCPAIIEGTFSVTVTEPLSFFLLEAPPICNNTLFGSILELSSLLDQAVQGLWTFEGEELADGIIDFDGFEEGIYTLEFSTLGFEDPCPGQTLEINIQVEECECPNLLFPDRLEVCADIGVWDLSDIFAESAEGDWSLIIPDGSTSAPELAVNILEFSSDNEGEFILLFTLTDSLPEECRSEWEIELGVEAPRNSGSALDFLQVCEGSFSEIDLQTLLENADEGGLWIIETGSEVDAVIDAGLLTTGENRFTYRITGELCADAETEVLINLNDRPVANFESQDPLCFGEDDGWIIANVGGEAGAGFSLILNGQDQGSLTATDLFAGTYEAVVRDELGCLSDEQVIVLIEPQLFTVSLGGDVEADPGASIEIEAEMSIPADQLSEIEWTFNSEFLQSGQLSVQFSPTAPGQLEVLVTNLDGCFASDAILITLSERTVYLPNVFRPGSDIAPNSSFGPFGMDGIETIISFAVFDRWGNRMHNVSDVSPQSSILFWDGTADSERASEGIYVYRLVYKDATGRTMSRAGEVLLIR